MSKGSTDRLAQTRAKFGSKLQELSAIARKKKGESKIVSIASEDLPKDWVFSGKVKRLTGPGYPLNISAMRRFLNRIEITNEQFVGWSGLRIQQWMELNSRWSQRAFEVLVVENVEHIKEHWNEPKV